MSEQRGAWSPSQSNLSKAMAVMDATQASGNLYREGFGMIASENIVSPMVQKIVLEGIS
jgi:glycine/serine hydroxymethyltransferase